MRKGRRVEHLGVRTGNQRLIVERHTIPGDSEIGDAQVACEVHVAYARMLCYAYDQHRNQHAPDSSSI